MKINITILFLFFGCSLNNNLKPNQAILHPISKTIYINNIKNEKKIRIININGKSTDYIFCDIYGCDKKVNSGIVNFIVSYHYKTYQASAKFKLYLKSQKKYNITAQEQKNNIIFKILLDDKIIATKSAKRKFLNTERVQF